MSESFKEFVSKELGEGFYDDNIGEKMAALSAFEYQRGKISQLEADLKAKDKEIERKGKLLTRVLNKCSHWLGDELFKDIFNELKLRDENA